MLSSPLHQIPAPPWETKPQLWTWTRFLVSFEFLLSSCSWKDYLAGWDITQVVTVGTFTRGNLSSLHKGKSSFVCSKFYLRGQVIASCRFNSNQLKFVRQNWCWVNNRFCLIGCLFSLSTGAIWWSKESNYCLHRMLDESKGNITNGLLLGYVQTTLPFGVGFCRLKL